MGSLLCDLRQAVRLLRRQPAFSAFAILILAVGIGSATAVFSLVQAVLLRDLPFADPGRLAWMYNARTERDRAPFSIPDLEDYRRDNGTLTGLATFTNWTACRRSARDVSIRRSCFTHELLARDATLAVAGPSTARAAVQRPRQDLAPAPADRRGGDRNSVYALPNTEPCREDVE